PNLVIATPADGTPEVTWKGKTLRVGTAVLSIQVPTIRCVMTTLSQGDLPKDPRILRTVVQHSNHHAGVYATVTQPGVVRVGDAVELLA
ncbi:MAG: MOSC domain-containing protein, partial [Candidatus Binatia bacterium]|nr:MOSC domain-containing protein [Candidatus Binatia bacterium]